ncbi:MAG: DUF4129 domain-containing protein [Dehalococcoidales bacterium]|nr:DUF4129 domain-containing protein [Dehalococcoidales bacterium]
MKPNTNWGRGILALLCAGALLLLNAGNVVAVTPHEDPETATTVFSGIALFQYYAYSLDSILLKNAAEAEAKLEKLPWANVPESLAPVTEDFAASGIQLARLVVQIDRGWTTLKMFREQSRLDEAAELATAISANLTEAKSELNRVEQAVTATGLEFKVSSAPEGSDLKISYQEVLDRIDRIREMLSLFGKVVEVSQVPVGELLTRISLSLEPMTAFVGDNVSFQGTLTSGQEPLTGRNVEILLNSSVYITVQTDASGRYQGAFKIPYWYRPELDAQALYYPRGNDKGVYLASLSPVVKLQVLFYPAELEIKLEAKAYPGRETSLSVRYDYGDAPVPEGREVEVYLDDQLITESTAQAEFVQKIVVDPNTGVGKHILTVSSAAAGRYAPVVASAPLEVAKATPILEIGLPRVTMIPGVLNLTGKIYSELGPVNNAQIKLAIGQSQVEFITEEAGAFATKMKLGMNLGIVGTQDLTIEVVPAEPWHAPLVVTRQILMVNVVNCASILVVLLLLGVYLPSRLRRRLGAYAPRKAPPPTTTELPRPAPAASGDLTDSIPEDSVEGGEPRRQVIYWYHFVTNLLARAAKAILKPQQTLREFAQECSRVLGPAANYFMVLTRILERILYSDYEPTAEDVEKSKQLSLTIKEKIKG